MINIHFKDYEEFGSNPQHTSGKHRKQKEKQKEIQRHHLEQQRQQEELERYNSEEQKRPPQRTDRDDYGFATCKLNQFTD